MNRNSPSKKAQKGKTDPDVNPLITPEHNRTPAETLGREMPEAIKKPPYENPNQVISDPSPAYEVPYESDEEPEGPPPLSSENSWGWRFWR